MGMLWDLFWGDTEAAKKRYADEVASDLADRRAVYAAAKKAETQIHAERAEMVAATKRKLKSCFACGLPGGDNCWWCGTA